MDKKFALTSLLYAFLGLALGIYMASSDTRQHIVTHAHIMLLGFLITFAYAVFHRLWLHNVSPGWATAQFYLHQIGTAVLLIGLFLMYQGIFSAEALGPILGAGSFIVFAGLILMMIFFFQNRPPAGHPA